MNKYSAPTVHFKCCSTTIEFHSPRMFQYCKCGECGYDSGDGRTARYLGNYDNIQVVGYNLTKDIEYCKKNNINYNFVEKSLTCADWSRFSVKITSFDGYVIIEDKGNMEINIGKTYPSLRDARKAIVKELSSGE